MTQDLTDLLPENPAQTVRDIMEKLGHVESVPEREEVDLTRPLLVSVPDGRTVTDLTAAHLNALQYLKPARRKGTARFMELESLIAWANRFKGPNSALFALPSTTKPSVTCIANYHLEGPDQSDFTTTDPSARHCDHRASYDFPLSDEWKIWSGISGKILNKDELGDFIEANAKDIMDPTPAILSRTPKDGNQPWENRLIETASQIEGRYGQLAQLLQMSKQFQIHETSNLTVTSNRDTGEGQIQFVNEHKSADGKPLSVPNLIIITIPVFQGGAPYRMPVRFRYRKAGGSVNFILTVYNPERSFQDAFKKAAETARDSTGLPLFIGSPED